MSSSATEGGDDFRLDFRAFDAVSFCRPSACLLDSRPRCELTAVNANWGGHHSDTDPDGQSPGTYPCWNYEYGTNIRVYGVAN